MTLTQKIEANVDWMTKNGIEPPKVFCEQIRDIQAAVCAAFSVTEEEMMLPRGTERVSNARIASMALCRERIEGVSFQEIAEAHGKIDHGCAFHASRVFPDKMETNLKFKAQVAIARLLLSNVDRQ